jgi:hypothetical protein
MKNLEGKRQSGRPRAKWEKSIKTNLKEMGWVVVDGTYPLQERENVRLL